jgi:hypothetical protein
MRHQQQPLFAVAFTAGSVSDLLHRKCVIEQQAWEVVTLLLVCTRAASMTMDC